MEEKNKIELNRAAKEVEKCKSCPLYNKENKKVFSKGNENARIMLIGEAPGEEEAKNGIPFVGTAGERLDKCLNKAGINFNDLYITNTVKCRPENNRNPKGDEIKTCHKFLTAQIEAVNPEIIILCGAIARKAFGINKPLKDCHGKVTMQDNRKLVPVYHPIASVKKDIKIKDFKKVKELLK